MTIGLKSRQRETATHHVEVGLTRGSGHMKYKGYVKGSVVILKTPLSVPDGTEVDVFISSRQGQRSHSYSGRSDDQRFSDRGINASAGPERYRHSRCRFQ